MSDPVFARPEKDPEFDPKRFLPRPLFESPEMKVVRATFRAGQFIPVHAPDVHVALYIVSGEGEVVARESSGATSRKGISWSCRGRCGGGSRRRPT